MAIAPVFPNVLQNVVYSLTSTSLVSIYTAPANGARIDSLNFTSTDTSNRDLSIYITVSGTDYLIGTISILANSGTISTVPAKAGLNDANLALPINDPYSNRVIILKGAAELKIQATALAGGKTITVTGLAGEF